MTDWTACFKLEAGKTYRIRYVYVGDITVREATLLFTGETTTVRGRTNIAVLQVTHVDTVPGPVDILSIDELSAGADVR